MNNLFKVNVIPFNIRNTISFVLLIASFILLYFGVTEPMMKISAEYAGQEVFKYKQSILELGSGSGVYSLALARQGHEVTGVELSSSLTDLAIKDAKKENLEANTNFLCLDVRKFFKNNKQSFDTILDMGPLYHLVDFEDRLELMKEKKI